MNKPGLTSSAKRGISFAFGVSVVCWAVMVTLFVVVVRWLTKN